MACAPGAMKSVTPASIPAAVTMQKVDSRIGVFSDCNKDNIGSKDWFSWRSHVTNLSDINLGKSE
jgi:hypothetical protein